MCELAELTYSSIITKVIMRLQCVECKVQTAITVGVSYSLGTAPFSLHESHMQACTFELHKARGLSSHHAGPKTGVGRFQLGFFRVLYLQEMVVM